MSNVRFPTATSAIRIVGALALLAAGGVHLQQYVSAHYSAIPTIGTLFMLNFIGATVLAVVLLAAVVVKRIPLGVQQLAALAGVLVAAGAIVALLYSEHTTLFGFREDGYEAPVLFALVSEALTVIALGAFLALSRVAGRSEHRAASAHPSTEALAR
jgi:hypothetical protein